MPTNGIMKKPRLLWSRRRRGLGAPGGGGEATLGGAVGAEEGWGSVGSPGCDEG